MQLAMPSGEFVRLVVLDNPVKFRDPRLNRSINIRLQVARSGIFDNSFRDNFWPEVATDVISGAIED